jgi:hypothetical protein
MLFTHSYRDLVSVLDLKPSQDKGPTVVFVGYGLNKGTLQALMSIYHVTVLTMSAEKLAVFNTDTANMFVTSDKVLMDHHTKRELWRVAQEGAKVVVFDTVEHGGRVTSLIPHNFNHRAHGFKSFEPGLLSFAPYHTGIIRKDLAEYFRR